MTAHGRKLFYKSKFRDEPSLESAKRRQKAPFGPAIRGVQFKPQMLMAGHK
jgi:hypothetical protein